MADMIKERAYAKINLTLDICGVRDDGYHLLKSIMQTVDLCDELEITRTAGGVELELIRDPDKASGHETVPSDGSNLVCRAAKLLLDERKAGFGVKIKLEKHIPAAAGMGGGSADAAAVLRGVNRLLDESFDEEGLCALGVRLGADVPFCIKGGTVLCEGIGEVMTPLPDIGRLHMVYVKPAVDVPTGGIYRAYDEKGDGVRHPDNESMTALVRRGNAGPSEVSEYLCNVFEPLVCDMHPEIVRIKEALKQAGACGSLMSGSGPTVFAIFNDAEKAAEGAAGMKRLFPDAYTGVCCTVEPVA